jgi:hypothetical protein
MWARGRRVRVALAVGLVAGLAGLVGGEPGGSGADRTSSGEPAARSPDDPAPGPGAGDPGTASASPGTATTAGRWSRIEPGGRTRCGRGGRFAFWARIGDPDRLLVFFEGGGGCWDYRSCAPGTALFDDDVDATDDPSHAAGVLDLDNPQNPFRGWSVLLVPSCTGDVFAGDAVRTYRAGSGTVTVHHRGHVNATAALEWMFERVPDPAGCSSPGAVPAVSGRSCTRRGSSGSTRTRRWRSSGTPSGSCSASPPSCGPCAGPAGCCPTGCRGCGRSRGPASPCRGSTRRSPATTGGRRSPRSTSTTTASSGSSTRPAGATPTGSAGPCWATWPPSAPGARTSAPACSRARPTAPCPARTSTP